MDNIWHHYQENPDILCIATQNGQHLSRSDVVECIAYDTYKLSKIVNQDDRGVILLVENSFIWLTLAIAALQLGLHVVVADRRTSPNNLGKIAVKTGFNCILSRNFTSLELDNAKASCGQIRFHKAWKFKKRYPPECNSINFALANHSGRLLSANELLRRPNVSPTPLTINRFTCASIYSGMLLTKGILPDSNNIQVIHHSLSRIELFAWALGAIHSGNILIILEVSPKSFAEAYKKLYTAQTKNISNTRISFSDPVR